MSSVSAHQPHLPLARGDWLAWWPLGLGLALLYLPTYIDLAGGQWQKEEHVHAPLVLLGVIWLLWRSRNEWGRPTGPGAPLAGVSVLLFGLSLYVLGRSQDITLFEVGSQIPVLAGIMLSQRGWAAVRSAWFPLIFLAFMVPLPAFLIDALTAPLKHQVSEVAEIALYAAGYPIARNGVVLTVGPYQLLVADACSGLHSMISLCAMGLLYLHLSHSTNRAGTAVIAASLLPIAFAANVVRVLLLVLVTYHFGDDTGQGFLHSFAGVALFAAALLMLFAVDGLLARFPMFRRQQPFPAMTAA